MQLSKIFPIAILAAFMFLPTAAFAQPATKVVNGHPMSWNGRKYSTDWKRFAGSYDSVASMQAAAHEDGDQIVLLGYYWGKGLAPWGVTYHETGRTGVTPDGGAVITGTGADDYFTAIDTSVAHVDRYGAKPGDATFDSRAAIQAAINSASPVVSFGSGGVYEIKSTTNFTGLAGGVYLTTTHDGKTLEGNGATLRLGDGVAAGAVFGLLQVYSRFGDEVTEDVTVRDLKLDVNKANQSGSCKGLGVYQYDSAVNRRILFDRLQVVNAKAESVLVGAESVTFRDLRIDQDDANPCIYLNGGADGVVWFDGVDLTTTGNYGFYLNRTGPVRLSRVKSNKQAWIFAGKQDLTVENTTETLSLKGTDYNRATVINSPGVTSTSLMVVTRDGRRSYASEPTGGVFDLAGEILYDSNTKLPRWKVDTAGGISNADWVSSGTKNAAWLYQSGGNCYWSAAAGTFEAGAPVHTSGTVDNLLYVGPEITLTDITAIANTPLVEVPGVTYTVTAGDSGRVLMTTSASAVTMTFPATLPKGFNVGVIQGGAGVVTFAAGAGGSVDNWQAHTKTAGQYTTTTVIAVENTDDASAEMILTGATAL